MTPAKHCKALTGLKLKDIADYTGKSRRTLEDWHRDLPRLFESVCIGVREIKQTDSKQR